MGLSQYTLGLVQVVFLVSLSNLATAKAKLPGLFEALSNNGATQFAALLQANPDLLDAAIAGDVGTIFAPIDSYYSRYATRAALNTTEQQALAYQISSRAQGWKNFTRPTLETLIETRMNEANLNGENQSVVIKIANNSSPSNTSSSSSINTPSQVPNGAKLPARTYGNPQPKSQWPSYAEICTGLGDIVNVIKPEIGFSKCGQSESRGFIHIIDRYFTLPQRLSDTLAKIPELSTFASILDTGCPCLKNLLDNKSSITIFIPNNEAFATAGITAETKGLEKRIEGLVIPDFVGYTPKIALEWGGIGLKTSLNGSMLWISATNIGDGPEKGQEQKLYVNDGLVIKRNIILENGVAHIIDKVI